MEKTISITVTETGAIVELYSTDCICPGEMLEQGQHLSDCKEITPAAKNPSWCGCVGHDHGRDYYNCLCCYGD